MARFSFRLSIACSLAGLILGVSVAGAVAIKVDPNGFNNYAWGMSASKYPQLKLFNNLGATEVFKKVELYENPEEAQTLKGVPVVRSQYRFCDDQLESISFRFEGREHRDALMQWLEDEYGKLVGRERGWKMVQWIGDDTTIALSFDNSTQKGSLWFLSRYLNNLYNETVSMTD